MPSAEGTDQRPGRLHLDFVDGLRGIAALYVVLHHVWQFSITNPTEHPPGWFRVFTVFKFGSYAVAVFIVVSGFCLMLPVLRHGGTGSRGGLPEFTRRRSRRILPPYFIVLGLSMLLIALDSDLRVPTATPWDITLPSFTVGKVLSHVFMIHNWSEAWQYAFDPPLWSIALEFQIYFVFALVLLPVWRRWGLTTVIAAAFAISVVPWALGAGFASPWMLGLFALGMGAALIGTSPTMASWRDRIAWRPVTLALLVAVPLVTAATAVIDAVDLQHMIRHTTVGLATATGLIVMSSDQLERRGTTALHRGLASPRLRSLGLFSFSLYLVHYPIVAVVSINWISRYDLTVPATFAVLLVICVPLSLAAAYGFYLLVERRFINSPLPTPAAVVSDPVG